MPKSIHERVRAKIAAQEKARQALVYKAEEHARRSQAARVVAEVRRERRINDLLDGRVEPRNSKEFEILGRLYEGES